MLSSLVVQRPFSCKIRDAAAALAPAAAERPPARPRPHSPLRPARRRGTAPPPSRCAAAGRALRPPSPLRSGAARRRGNRQLPPGPAAAPPLPAGPRARAAGAAGPCQPLMLPTEAKRPSSGGPAGSPRQGTARRSRPPPPGEGLPRLVWRRPKPLLRRERASHVSAFRSPLRRAGGGANRGRRRECREGEGSRTPLFPAELHPPYY